MSEKPFGGREGALLAEPAEAIREMQKLIDSREWWVIPAVTQASTDLAVAVETRFYAGKAGDDFAAVMIPRVGGVLLACMFFAHKRRMTAEQLAGLVGIPAGQAADRDILMTPDTPLDFVAWLQKTFGKGGTRR